MKCLSCILGRFLLLNKFGKKYSDGERRPFHKKVACYLHVLNVGLSPSKKICVICLIERHLKIMKNAFYFILKALFVLKVF